MADLLAQLADGVALHGAWLKVRGNHGGPGGDGVALGAFAADLMPNLDRLALDLRHATYRPGPLRRVEIPKKRGGRRTLAIPCVVDRIAQTAAATLLQPVLEAEFEDASFGYRPGRSVRMAVDRVSALRRRGFDWVVDADIEAFFDNVPHAELLTRLRRHVDDGRLLELVELWLAGAEPDGRGIAQGSPLSPLLANLYLDELDERIAAKGVHIVRFADDFLILCRSELQARGALERTAAVLAGLGLTLNLEKTRIVSFEQGVRFLGRLFLRSIVVESREEEEATAELDRVLPLPGAMAAPDRLGQAAELEQTLPVVASFPELVPPVPAPEVGTITAEEPGGDRFAPYIAPLYVMLPGREVGLRNEAFTVSEDGIEFLALPPGKLDRIELGPAVTITTAALRQAVAWGIPVDLLDGVGRTIGMTVPPTARRSDLQLAHAAHVLDEAKRLHLARSLVAGRLGNQRALLKRLNRRRKRPEVEAATEAITRCRRRLVTAGSVAEAMGLEGEAAACYWPALGACLEHGWRLDVRRRHPAPDAVNSVLDWLAWLVTRDVHALVLRHGLHPGFGLLHGTRRGHDACAYDLVEEFRAPLAEGLAIYLFNNRILEPGDFTGGPEEGVRLTGGARTVLIRQYESWLDREVKSPRRRRATTWRGLIDEQVGAFAAHLLGGDRYAPYAMDY